MSNSEDTVAAAAMPRRSSRGAQATNANEETPAAAASTPAAKRGRRRAAAPAEEAADVEEEEGPQSKRKRGPASSADAAAASSSPPASSAAAAAAAASSADVAMEDDDGDDAGQGGSEEPDDVEALAASLGLSVYEYNRQQNIKLKNEQLQLLNLQGMATDLGLKRTAAAPAPRSSSRRSFADRVPTEGLRRSSRAAGAPPQLYTPEVAGTGGALGWGRQERKPGPLTFEEARVDEGGKKTQQPSKLEKETKEENKEEAEAAAAAAGEAEESKEESKESKEESKEEEEEEAKELSAENKQYEAVLAALGSVLRLSDADTEAKAAAAVKASYAQPRSVAAGNMKLLGEGVKIIKQRATVLQYHPTASLGTDYSILAAADKVGNVSVAKFSKDCSPATWAASVEVARFAPHSGSVVQLLWGRGDEGHLLYSASQDGSLRRMDVAAQVWDEVYVANDDGSAGISAMAMSNEQTTIYCADRSGVMTIVDPRAGEGKKNGKHTQHTLSTHKLNGLSINPRNDSMLASCGNDRTVRVWDLRQMKKELKAWTHGFSVNHVTFSPSGKMMASTSYDDTIRLHSCVNSAGDLLSPTAWSDPLSIKHNNHTGQWVTTFRALFAPCDTALAIGDMARAIDVFTFPTATNGGRASAAAAASSSAAAAAASSSNSKSKRKSAASPASSSSSSSSSPFSTSGPGVPVPVPAPMLTLSHAEYVTSIPSALAWHPTRVQVAGCTSSGRIYVFGHNNTKK